MPYRLTIHRSRGFYRAKFHGIVTGAEIMEFARRHSLDKELFACRRVLMDLVDAEFKGVSFEQNEVLADMLIRFLKRRGVIDLRTAIVVAEPFQVGIANQYRLIAQSRGVEPGIYDFRPFTDRAEALAWLGQPEDPPPG